MIPFNKPFIIGKELYNIANAVIEKKQLAGDGYFTKYCQSWLTENLECSFALLTHSCTAALEMAALLCNISDGDEVIMPSYTFVSTANAFVLRGGTPVFVDIRPDTLNIDEKKIEEAITERTKAIVPVHYAGIPCEMDVINSLADEHGLFVIEDAAQALLSTYKGKYLGTIGHIGTLSFHETKNIISGEGGALLLNRDISTSRAEIIWEKGTDRKKFYRGEVDKYSWVDLGSSYLPSEIIAAFLAAQFDCAKEIIEKRKRIYDLYYSCMLDLEREGYLRLPYLNNESYNNGHIFFILTNTAEERIKLISRLKDHEIFAIFHYVPLHSSPAGRRYGRFNDELRITDSVSERVLRLPLHYEMTEDEVRRVVGLITAFYKKG